MLIHRPGYWASINPAKANVTCFLGEVEHAVNLLPCNGGRQEIDDFKAIHYHTHSEFQSFQCTKALNTKQDTVDVSCTEGDL